MVFLSTVFIGIPLALIFLNNYFDLPIYTNLYFKIFGCIFLLAGFSVVIYSTFLHIKTGRATPLPVIEKPRKFIVSEFYKYSRNPMYLAEVFIFLGLFFLLGDILLFLYPMGFFIIINLFVIYIEEPEIRRKFGKEYAEYTKKVPRWIPKF